MGQKAKEDLPLPLDGDMGHSRASWGLQFSQERSKSFDLDQGRQTHFHQGSHQPQDCLQRAGCNFNSLTVKEYLHLYSPKIILTLLRQLRGRCGPRENEFDTPDLDSVVEWTLT